MSDLALSRWRPLVHAGLAWGAGFAFAVVPQLYGEAFLLLVRAPLAVALAFTSLALAHRYIAANFSVFASGLLFALGLELSWYPHCPLFSMMTDAAPSDLERGLVLTHLLALSAYWASAWLLRERSESSREGTRASA